MQPIDHYKLSIFLAAIVTSALVLFIFITAFKNRLARAYCIYVATIAMWAICWYGKVTASTLQMDFVFGRLLHVPAVFVLLAFLYFVQTLLGIETQKRQVTIRKFVLMGCFLNLLMFPTDAFIPSKEQRIGYPFFVNPGPLYAVYVTFFFSGVVYAFYLLLRGYKASTGFLKTQIAHISVAYFLGYVGAFGIFFSIYSVPMPPALNYLIVIAHLWIFYAILRHRLLDIRIVIRRTGLFFLIYMLLLIFLIPILQKLHQHVYIPLTEIIIAAVLLSAGPFLYAFVIRRSTYFHEDTIAGLTHEMKTPLAAIQSALEILNTPIPQSAVINEDYFQMIRSNATRLQGFVDSLLQVLGDEKAAINLQCDPMDIRLLCSQAIAANLGFATMKGLKISGDLPEQAIRTSIDAVKIAQALSNILSNAIKFTDHGSIHLTLRELNREIRITIQDTGIGLLSDEIPRVFDRFYQGKLGKQKKGTGIGLTLTKHWVEAHGGKIWAESDGEGKGTTVTFTLPLN